MLCCLISAALALQCGFYIERVANQKEKISGEETLAAEAPASALGETVDIMTALQMVLRKSLGHGGLARGLHEGAKVIDKLCVLAEDYNQPDYVQQSTQFPSAKTLGEYARLCIVDSEGRARKVIGCSCVAGKKLQVSQFVKHGS